MAEEQISRVVITDAGGKLVGVLSLVDLIEQVRGRKTLKTARAVLWREALGPRAGAPKGQPLLKDDPIAWNQPRPEDEVKVVRSAMTGGHHDVPGNRFPVG